MLHGFPTTSRRKCSPEDQVDTVVDGAHRAIHQDNVYQARVIAAGGYCGVGGLGIAFAFLLRVVVDIVGPAVAVPIANGCVGCKHAGEATVVYASVRPLGMSGVLVGARAQFELCTAGQRGQVCR